MQIPYPPSFILSLPYVLRLCIYNTLKTPPDNVQFLLSYMIHILKVLTVDSIYPDICQFSYFSFVLEFPGFFIIIYLLCYSAQSAMIKYHRLSGLNNRNLFSYGLGDQKSQIKVLADAGPGEDSCWLANATFSLCPHMAFLLCSHREGKHTRALLCHYFFI